ncbi:MAG: murein hydrolase activator EnvC family protein [Methylophilaceae bacterium]
MTTSNSEESVKDNQSDLVEIQKKIDALDKKINQKKKVKKGLTKELKKEEKKISKTKKEIHKIKKQERKNKKKLSKLKKDSSELKKNIQSRKENQSLNYYYSYTQGQVGSLQMLLEGINPNKITRDLRYLGFFSEAQNNNIKKIKDNLNSLEIKKKKIDKTIKKIASLKKTEERKKKKLEKEKKKKRKVLTKINKEISSGKKKKGKLIADEKKLTNIIEDLIKKSKVVTKKKKVKEKIKADNKSLPDPSLDKLHFKKLKKKLKLPIKGKIIHKFGKKRPDTGIKWKGIFIKANEGDPVYAVAKGKVVFSDWLRGFGNIIIIDHGGDYMSLYGNNESLLKKQNDMIRGGDQIATVGNSGGNNSNGLYYELRKNSKPFNPLAWTNLK